MSFLERGAMVWAGSARAVEPYFWLLVRVALGATFASTGWGKLVHLDRTIGFFRELGIPAPELQAPFIGGLELVGGICVALGLFTRFVAVPLALTMLVAIATALWPDIHTPLDLLTLDEALYLTLFCTLASRGAGPLSLDHWLVNRASFLRHAWTEPTPPVAVG
jgi:putative oxidoreductase